MQSLKKRPSIEDEHVVPNKTWKRVGESTSRFHFGFSSEDDELLNEESAAELFQQIRNKKEAEEISRHTRLSSNTHVLLCSSTSFSDATQLLDCLKTDIDILICDDKNIFSERNVLSPKNKKMYMLVDSSLCDIVMDKRRLHDCVDDYFEEFAAAASKVCLINRLPPSEQWRYLGLKCQLPQECITEHVEIELNTAEGMMEEKNQSLSDTDIKQEEDNSTSDSEAEDLQEKDNIVSTTGDPQLTAGLSDQGHCVQIGYKCSMNIEKPLNQRILVRQNGVENNVSVKIVPSSSVSKVVIVITTDPENPELEGLLHHEIDENLQVINLKLRNVHEASIVDKRIGSIIIEIEAKPGIKIDYNWIKNVIETIFIDELQSHIDPHSHLKLDVEGTFAIPLRDSGTFFMENDIHKNCVSMEKYDAKEQELDKLTEELARVRKAHCDCVTKEKYEVVSRELDKLNHFLAEQNQLPEESTTCRGDVRRIQSMGDKLAKRVQMKEKSRQENVTGKISPLFFNS